MPTKKDRVTRVAAYLRYSSEHQRGNTSLDGQREEIEAWCERNNAVIVETYVDEAKTARNVSNRSAVKRLHVDALNKRFDAVVVAVWDRLGRNAVESGQVRSFLRDDAGLTVFSATEMGADDDENSGVLMEGIKDVLNQNYSLELSKAFKRGKRQIWKDGWWIASQRPYGFKIIPVTVGVNKIGKPIIRHYLEPIPDEVKAVQQCFELYATGHYSLADIASVLNSQGLKTTRGLNFQPFTIQGILVNTVYLSQVRHQESHSDITRTKRYYDKPVEYNPGKHEAIISQELFDKVSEMREYRKLTKHGAANKKNAYLLQGLVWCWHCHEHPQEHSDVFGKMTCKTDGRRNDKTYVYYLCSTRHKGYECPQPKTPVKPIDEQVLWLLRNLRLPADWKARLIRNVAAEMTDAAVEARIAEIKGMIERLDKLFVYDGGFMLPEREYVEQRAKLIREYNQLSPGLKTDHLADAADLVANFADHFEACKGDVLRQNQLIRKLVNKVFVEGRQVAAIQFNDEAHSLLHLGGDILRQHEYGTHEEIFIDELRDEDFQRDADEPPTDDYDLSQHTDDEGNIIPPQTSGGLAGAYLSGASNGYTNGELIDANPIVLPPRGRCHLA